ncbi:MAG: hypothetical protein WD844_11310 [Thermoleophilaceae bacterium]
MAARVETLHDWLREHPPPDRAFRQSLAGVARRVRAGDEFLPAVREFMDEFALLPRGELRARAIEKRPVSMGDRRWDAYLGALAEHLAAARGLDRPGWAVGTDRFLDRFWFVSPTPGLRALAIVHSPAAFRRRGIFLGPGALDRC